MTFHDPASRAELNEVAAAPRCFSEQRFYNARLARAALRLRTLGVFVVCAVLGGCGSPTLAPFSSDGCSLFPDRSVLTEADWCSCCFEHDIAYWRGGTEAQRLTADRALRTCVAEKTGNATLAEVMFKGVRSGGSPYFVNWYRWGYGWGLTRTYGPLSRAEQDRADALLSEYFAAGGEKVCAAADQTSSK